MPSKKRELKIDLTHEADIPDYDVLLPAAVKFARDLLCGDANNTAVVLHKETIRNGRCFITLRFPDGQIRECYFGKICLNLTLVLTIGNLTFVALLSVVYFLPCVSSCSYNLVKRHVLYYES